MRFLALAGLVGLATTAPLTSHNAVLPGTSIKLSESQPWKLKHLVVFKANDEARAVTNRSSYIAFHFEDINKGLALNTTCRREVAGDSDETLADSSYQNCDSAYVNFIYDGEKLQIEHLYKDASLGPAPYDGGIAFGHTGFNLTRTKVHGGVLMVQKEIRIPITSISA